MIYIFSLKFSKISKILFCFFILLHITFLLAEDESEEADMKVYCPRGLYRWYPLDTKIAFVKALEIGADLEFDLNLTKDGHIIVFHDDDCIERAMEGKGKVCERTLKEVKELKPSSWLPSEYNNEQVITFKQFLTLIKESELRKTYLSVHLRPSMKGQEKDVIDMLKEFSMLDRIVIYYHAKEDIEAAKRLKEIDRDIMTVAWAHNKEQFFKLLDVSHIDCINCFEFFMVFDESFPKKKPDNWRKGWVCRELVDKAHRKDKRVNVALIDYAPRWKELKEMGVDGIYTDFPAELLNWLRYGSEREN